MKRQQHKKRPGQTGSAMIEVALIAALLALAAISSVRSLGEHSNQAFVYSQGTMNRAQGGSRCMGPDGPVRYP